MSETIAAPAEQAFDVNDYKSQVFDKPTVETPPAPAAEATSSTEATTTVQEPVVETTPAPEVTPTENQDIIDDLTYLKQQVGYDDWAKVKADLEELKQLREKAATPAEIAFANEESKKIHEYLRQGKEDEVREYLAAKKQMANLDTMNDEQQLKLFIRLSNPMFDEELVDVKYQQLYKLDESQFTNELDEIDPIRQRLAKAELNQRIQTDIQKAKEHFAQYKAKLDLPNIDNNTAQQATPVVDEAYEAYKKDIEQGAASHAMLQEALTKLSENDFPFKFSFSDEANKIKFDVDFKMDKDGLNKAREAAANYGDYLAQNYNRQDGSPAGDKLMRDIYVAQNLDKIIAESNKQAVNNTIKWFLSNQKNIGENVQRNYTTVVPDDIAKLKHSVFG